MNKLKSIENKLEIGKKQMPEWYCKECNVFNDFYIDSDSECNVCSKIPSDEDIKNIITFEYLFRCERCNYLNNVYLGHIMSDCWEDIRKLDEFYICFSCNFKTHPIHIKEIKREVIYENLNNDNVKETMKIIKKHFIKEKKELIKNEY